MQKILGFVGIGVSGLTLLLAIMALLLKYWQTTNLNGTTDVNVGLWEYCVETNSVKTCTKIDSNSVKDKDLKEYRSVRGTLFVGILLTTGAIITAILVLFVLKDKKILYFLAAGLDVAAGLFFMISMAVYADNIAQDDYDYHVCFAMDIVAWLMAWIGGAVFAGAKLLDRDKRINIVYATF